MQYIQLYEKQKAFIVIKIFIPTDFRKQNKRSFQL